MIRLRAATPLHLFFGLSISMTAVLGSPVKAHAQVDLNLQNRIETYTTSITAQPEVMQPQVTQRQATFRGAPTTEPDCLKFQDLRKRSACIRKVQPLIGPFPTPLTPDSKEQPTKIKFSFPFNPGYESNVLKSNQNIHPDSLFGLGGTVLVTTGGVNPRENPYDVVAFGAGEATTRYTQFSSKSVDVVTTQGAYQFLINAYDGNGQAFFHQPFPTKTTQHYDFPVSEDKKTVQQDMISFSTLAFGFQNQTAFLPTFRHEQADLFTPQITLARTNIPLGDITHPCATASPEKKGFCYYADLSLTFGHTLSDVTTQQNTNVAASAMLGWRVPDTDWKVTLPSTATARYYENVAGGRQDLLLQIGPTFAYAPTPKHPNSDPSFSLSLSVTYNQNFSTLSTAAWHGFIVKPTFTMALPTLQ